ncbi:MAG: YbgC/FadM family acyl-CoA thioesterase [Alphaproteobacteria bacterium]|nr:YbgC/FadM family acyl-CoA thioesterase [Alphaproteobacteria bacterium]
MKHKMDFHIYYQDTDAGGIVYHSNYLDYAERARSELLFDMGVSNTILAEQGLAFVLRQVHIDYRKPARLDDLLTVETVVIGMKNASMEMEQTFFKDDDVLVVIRLQLAFVNPNNLRPIRIPDTLKELFLKYYKES